MQDSIREGPGEELTLARDGGGVIAADAGTLVPGAEASVLVTRLRTGEPAAGIAVRFEVVSGPAALGAEARERVDTRSGEDGRASVPVRIERRGAALVSAQLTGSDQICFFHAHSNQRAHTLWVYVRPAYEAEAGTVRVLVSAVDHHDDAVTRAELTLTAVTGVDTMETGRVREIGDGRYEAEFATRVAGEWRIIVQDRETKTAGHARTRVLPAAPKAIRLADEADSRQSEPFGEVTLRARLEDRFGNALEPGRITAKVDRRPVVPDLAGEEARVTVRHAGYGAVRVELRDRESRTSLAVPVAFAAAWLQSPSLIEIGTRFRTPVYWLPPAKKKTGRAVIRIRFDAERASFVAFEPAETAEPALRTSHAVGANVLEVTVSAKPAVAGAAYPNGIWIGDAVWDCTGEGSTCFVATAEMSPETPGWELCVSQKESRRKCVCTNFVYPPGDAAAERQARARADSALRQAAKLLNSADNVAACCPLFSFQENFHPMTAGEWTTVTAAIGHTAAGPSVTSAADAVALDHTKVGIRDHCINIYLIPTGGGFNGITDLGPPGNSVIAPAAIDDAANGTPPHEIGHALGLPDVDDPKNVMHRRAPAGSDLTKDQCRTIWGKIDSYPCQAI